MTDGLHAGDFLKARWEANGAAAGAYITAHAKALEAGKLGYEAAIEHLSLLRNAGALGDFSAFAQAWPQSIDMLALTHDLSEKQYQRHDIRERLTELTRKGGRKFATLAQIHLDNDDPDLAREVLARTCPGSDTYTADLARLIILDLKAGDFQDAQKRIKDLECADAQAQAQVLSLRATYLSEGMAALGPRIDRDLDTLLTTPGMIPALWSLLMNERDILRAQTLLQRLEAGGDALLSGDERGYLRAQLALETDRADTAQQFIKTLPGHDTPWLWPARRLILVLRTALAGPHPALVLNPALAAERVFARHDMIRHLTRMARMVAGHWSWLGMELNGTDPGPAPARMLLRIGLPEIALNVLARAENENDFRTTLIKAEAYARAGDLPAARRLLNNSQPPTAPDQADRAHLAADLALDARDLKAARRWLHTAEAYFPDRLSLWPLKVRLFFLQGDFAAAAGAYERFIQIRAAHSPEAGKRLELDPRARLTKDASQSLPMGLPGPKAPIARILDTLGPAQVFASPGLSACLLERAMRMDPKPQVSAPGTTIPKRLMFYWEGATSHAVEYSIGAWRDLHPDWEINRFNGDTARLWLEEHDAPLLPAFDRLGLPAERADLFRLAWLQKSGGVYADPDEFSRAPIDDWLEGNLGLFCFEKGFGTIANNFIGAVPGFSVLTGALNLVQQTVIQNDPPLNAWWHTGPAALTRVLAQTVLNTPTTSLRILSPQEYATRVSTNLPFPHKRSETHWRG